MRNEKLTIWPDIIRITSVDGNPEPPQRVDKSDEEWQAQLTPEEYHVTRLKGTEQPFSSEMCGVYEPGIYACRCCATPLFNSGEKFDSGTGWPSFTQPLEKNLVAYEVDNSHGRARVEALCNICEAHLGHVFPDGPEPSGLRYCMNAVSLRKVESADDEAPENESLATFGGGCFWCTEAVFQNLEGVHHVESGYAGGDTEDPSYREVCSGSTGHAEVIQVSYDPEKITYADLLRVHLGTHDPTTLNRQGADTGTQYRSVIFYRNEAERKLAETALDEAQEHLDDDIVTELEPHETYYPAEDAHQNYYNDNRNQGYCSAVIPPKLAKLREKFSHFMKK